MKTTAQDWADAFNRRRAHRKRHPEYLQRRTFAGSLDAFFRRWWRENPWLLRTRAPLSEGEWRMQTRVLRGRSVRP